MFEAFKHRTRCFGRWKPASEELISKLGAPKWRPARSAEYGQPIRSRLASRRRSFALRPPAQSTSDFTIKAECPHFTVGILLQEAEWKTVTR